MRTFIKNAKIVTPERVIEQGGLLIKDGVIAYVGQEEQSAEKVIDAMNAYLLPGFIDLHCHGGANLEFMDASVAEIGKIADFHLSHGTTTLYATTLSAEMQETETALETFAAYHKAHENSTLEGVHMEGPWLNPLQCGAQDVSKMRTPSVEELEQLKEKYPFVKRVSIAPELENGYEFGKRGKELGIVMGIAHSDAEFTECEKALGNGYNVMTHLYSGMKGVTRKNCFRIAGAVEAGLYFDDYYVEVIGDGRHLPLELLKFIYKNKGADKICLITDAIRASGLPNGSKTKIGSLKSGLDVVVEQEVAKLANGTAFAGSTATADRLFRTMAEAIGKDMVALSKMCSGTPAKLMGLQDRGEIAVGKTADLIVMDENLEIKQVITNKEN